MLAGTVINDERQRVGCTRLGEGSLVGIADLRDVDGIAVPHGGAGDLVEVADLQGDEAVVATGNQRTIAGLSHLIAVADLLGAPEIVLALDAHLRVVGIARLRDADGVVIGVADNAMQRTMTRMQQSLLAPSIVFRVASQTASLTRHGSSVRYEGSDAEKGTAS